MVFHPEGQFQQFPHCKFRDNVVRLLYISSTSDWENIPDNPVTSNCFMSVNKFGKIGLYHPEKFSLLHTYCLDLSVHVSLHSHLNNLSTPITPKCERTHLVIDAVYSSNMLCAIFATTKNILQFYDIGEIQRQNIGLELFPRKEFMGLNELDFPVQVPNKGHVESHRLIGLTLMPNCLEYCESIGRLLIGDIEGGITIISFPDPRLPLGKRKIRGQLHKLSFNNIVKLGIVQYYKAHREPVTDIHFILERELILTCSRDKKFSIFVKDFTNTSDSIIVSISKGVNAVAHSVCMKMVATGSDDHIVRLFSQFILKMPQMELLGHRSAVLAVEFLEVDFADNSLLLSYSVDSELRAWDPVTFICMQSVYMTFPIGSTIMCKTPEFGRKPLFIFKASCNPNNTIEGGDESKQKRSIAQSDDDTYISSSECKKQEKLKWSATGTSPRKGGTIILLYCNSYARIRIENSKCSLKEPFDFDDFIQEFEELSMEYDKKLKMKLKSNGQSSVGHPHVKIDLECMPESLPDEQPLVTVQKQVEQTKKLSFQDMLEVESKLDKYVEEILELRRAIQESGSVTREERKSSGNTTGRLSMTSSMDDSTHSTNFNISVEATNRFYEFNRQKAKKLPTNIQRKVSYGHAFNQYQLASMEPIEFTKKNLPIPEKMKKIFGIQSLNSVQELLTPEAQQYFGAMNPHHHSSSSCSKEKRKKQKGNLEHKIGHQNIHSGTVQHGSRFTVVGQRIHQSTFSYDDNNFLFDDDDDDSHPDNQIKNIDQDI